MNIFFTIESIESSTDKSFCLLKIGERVAGVIE